ncbi:hypothetical protein Dimus_009424 [Dionaea muscipula]
MKKQDWISSSGKIVMKKEVNVIKVKKNLQRRRQQKEMLAYLQVSHLERILQHLKKAHLKGGTEEYHSGWKSISIGPNPKVYDFHWAQLIGPIPNHFRFSHFHYLDFHPPKPRLTVSVPFPSPSPSPARLHLILLFLCELLPRQFLSLHRHCPSPSSSTHPYFRQFSALDLDTMPQKEEESIPEDDDSEGANVKRFMKVIKEVMAKEDERHEKKMKFKKPDPFDFGTDYENWTEADLKELWGDGPLRSDKTGWDPYFVDGYDADAVREMYAEGGNPTVAPFYVPYRGHYPVIARGMFPDISTPKAVITELDRIEEFLKWVSYIFKDGSSYEGTVWDDYAQGKGVYIAEDGLVRYEGEWLQNGMEGHGVVEVDVPEVEPLPGSRLEKKLRAKGRIFKRDFMNKKDRKWLEMDMVDSAKASRWYEVPWYENRIWEREFGMPEEGRYRYAGQWKRSRMHGCGVYEVNEKMLYGRFYFGELMVDPSGCDEETCALHAGIAEVAAAKARMFVNKPDGMVRERWGPYSDPQHPYFYEEEDVWQAPGFINQFFEVPDYWKTYVEEVDQERELWLNSFYKAPLRLPMPAELEHWWEKDQTTEFVIVNKEPEPDPEDPSKIMDPEEPVIIHMPTGRVINYIEDEEHGIRLFYQPPLEEGEEIDPEKVEFLPLGFDEYYGLENGENPSFWKRLIGAVQNKLSSFSEKIDKWADKQLEASEARLKEIEKELEFVEAELQLEEAIEDLEELLKEEAKEKSKKTKLGLEEKKDALTSTPSPVKQEEEEETTKMDEEIIDEDGEKREGPPPRAIDEKDDDEDNDDDDNNGDAPSSFGSVGVEDDQNGDGSGDSSAFSTITLSSHSMVSAVVPCRLFQSFLSWKENRLAVSRSHDPPLTSHHVESDGGHRRVSFQKMPITLRLTRRRADDLEVVRIRPCSKRKKTLLNNMSIQQQHLKEEDDLGGGMRCWLHRKPKEEFDAILSLHMPLRSLASPCVV